MAQTLQDIMDAIATIQLALTPPSGAKDIALATDQPPVQIMTFPAFVNVEEASAITGSLASAQHQVAHRIAMHLLFAPFDPKYAVRERRPWTQVVIDGFRGNIGGTCQQAFLTDITYEPFEWPDLSENRYVASNFILDVRTQL
jgi:hypothetical protein